MALLARLFSPRKTNKKEKPLETCQNLIKDSKTYSYTVNKSEVRVLMFRECDWRGRKLLFDSTSVEKVPLDAKTPMTQTHNNSNDLLVEFSKGFGYKYKKPHGDTTALGETIFGSIAMATRGPSMKIHVMNDPARIMFTKVIKAPRSGIRRRQISNEKTLNDSQGSSVNSLGDNCNSGSFDSKQGSFERTLDDSGFVGGRESSGCDWLKPCGSQHGSCSSCCPLNNTNDGDQTNSCNSLHSGSSLSSIRRRWARSVATTLDITDSAQPPPPPGKRTKLGIALIIPLAPSNPQEMEQFLLDRLPLMNNIVTRLQHSTERAYCRRDTFVQSMLQASVHATQSVFELVCGSRLDKPVWLTLTSNKTDVTVKTELTTKLVRDLSHLLTTLDTKHTNFFISTLVTAVLTHHLGWVPTVFPDLPVHSDNMFTDLSRSHPYNPLWAQLSDLQGALGYPPKIAKTVVVGRSEILVQKLLSILSYFIRCGQVNMKDLKRDMLPDEENHLEYLLNHEQDNVLFDKDAMKEFCTAGSSEVFQSESTSTLTKSKTVLSMKTFSVMDCDLDNTNSLESGFESCNEYSGESYEDSSRIVKPMQGLGSKLAKSRSSNKLSETSFSQNFITAFSIGDDKMLTSCSESPSQLSVVKLLENAERTISKVEHEKQFTSTRLITIANRIHSESSLFNDKSKHNSFIKENLLQSDSGAEGKENKVVFVLGENEELVNIKGQDEANLHDLSEPVEDVCNNFSSCEPPVILIDLVDTQDSDIGGERCKTENKTDFVAGGISNRVVIVHSTPINLEGPENLISLRTNQLQRCLSVPEEAVSETDWVKHRRSKEAVQLIRRWLSDSDIERTPHKPLPVFSASENTVSELKLSSGTPASVFRTSNRSLKDTTVNLSGSVEELVDTAGCEVPTVAEDYVDMQPSLLIDNYINLPSQSFEEQCSSSQEVDLATSLFGAVSQTYCPELVLQGVTHIQQGWDAEMQRTLLIEALDQELAEAVCIVANTDTWEVEVVSSHSVRVDPNQGVGVRVGMSQLVSNMLETTQHLCSLSSSPDLCLSHVETKLSELCVRSQALAELLINSDFLDIATLTSTLDLDANDVPLLLSVASTHTPLVTRKYGLSFQ